MLIAILSDTHSNEKNVALALRLLEGRGVECILHCGDITELSTVHLFAGTPTHFVLGNCDYDAAGILQAVKDVGLHCHGRFADLELSGRRIAMIHGDDHERMEDEIEGGQFDYLFYGHTHVAEQRRRGRTRVVNPGALHRARAKTLALLDLQGDRLETLTVAP